MTQKKKTDFKTAKRKIQCCLREFDGKADKKKMIEYCIKRWNITPVDDNMADATHIFKYYVRIYKLQTENELRKKHKAQATKRRPAPFNGIGQIAGRFL